MNNTTDGVEFAAYVSEQFAPLVRRWSRSVDGVVADAEEVVQDSMIALARKWPHIDNLDGWMHRVCERGAARVIRQRQHPTRGALPLDEDYAETLTDDQNNPAADSEAYQLARELATGQLEWEILTLHAEGYSLAQIADAVRTNPSWDRRRMGCTPANIGKLLRYEKERLSNEISHRLAARKAECNDRTELIMRAVLRLPQKQRQAFGLRLLGYEPVKIAARMRSRPITARGNLSHANRKLAVVFGLDPGDATQVPTFVATNLGRFHQMILLGASLPEGATMNTSLDDREDEASFIAGAMLRVAFEIGRIAAIEKPALVKLLPTFSERSVFDQVLLWGIEHDQLKGFVSQLGLDR